MQPYIRINIPGLYHHHWNPNHYVAKEQTFYRKDKRGITTKRFAICGVGETIIEALLDYDTLLQNKFKQGYTLTKPIP